MPVIAIGLDSAEPKLIEQWISEGDLPNMGELKARGAYGRLANYELFTAELPWTTFATGTTPENTGYWTPLKYSPDYKISTRAAYEYDKYQAFYALGENYRVCSFDIPQVRLQPNLNGIQINAWGAHSPQVEQESLPSNALQEVIENHGAHPGLHRDYAHTLNMKKVKAVYDMLFEGTQKRGAACVSLLKKEPWDLFLTVFGEAHGAGHNFWQFEPDHPLYNAKIPHREIVPERPLKDIYQEIDKQIGAIVAAAPKDADIIVYSAHGMGPNTMDLPSTLFLPEFMYRYNFKRPALCANLMTPEQLTTQKWNNWERHVWATLDAGSPIAKAIRKHTRTKIYNILAPLVGDDIPGYPMSPRVSAKINKGVPWFQPSVWYSNLWPQMRAFALPSFSEGYIRINVKGREANGIVEPGDFESEMNTICAELNQLKCARTGTPMVKKIMRMRKTPLDIDAKQSDADIVIAWQEDYASDSMEHPEYGLWGPTPQFRGGSHRHEGFIIAKGHGIEEGSQISGHALDIGPSILSRLSAPIPEHLKGAPIAGLNV